MIRASFTFAGASAYVGLPFVVAVAAIAFAVSCGGSAERATFESPTEAPAAFTSSATVSPGPDAASTLPPLPTPTEAMGHDATIPAPEESLEALVRRLAEHASTGHAIRVTDAERLCSVPRETLSRTVDSLGVELRVTCGETILIEAPTRTKAPTPTCLELCNLHGFWLGTSVLSEGKVVEMVLKRLEAGEDPADTGYLPSPLHHGLRVAPHDDVINLLLDWGADINRIGDIHEVGEVTPLHYAVYLIYYYDFPTRSPEEGAKSQRYKSLVRLLLSRGADPSITDGYGRTPLFTYVYGYAGLSTLHSWGFGAGDPAQPDTEIIRLLIENGGGAIDNPVIGIISRAGEVLGYDGGRDLLWSVFHAKLNVEAVELLLGGEGADPHHRLHWINPRENPRDDMGGGTWLHLAADRLTSLEIFEFLISLGLDPSVENEYGDTACDFFYEEPG